MYPVYRRTFGFSELVVTAIYAVFAVGNVVVLMFFGRLSDQIGRRRATLIAFGLALLSMLGFLFAQSTGWLFAARASSGFAVGLGATAATAWIAELEPAGDRARAASIASAANLAGLASGALVAGLLAQHAPWPLRTSFIVYLVLLLVVLGVLAFAPETIADPVDDVREISLRPRIGVPSGLRLAFVAPAAMAFTAFSLGGFYSALAPGVLTQTLRVDDLGVIGLVVAAFFATATATAMLTRRVGDRASMFAAFALLLVGVTLLLIAEARRALVLLVVASVVNGAAMAFGYRASLQIVNALAPEQRRAELVSAYLLVCYGANSLPVIGVGALSLAVEPAVAHRILAGVLVALAAVACVATVRYAPKPQRAATRR